MNRDEKQKHKTPGKTENVSRRAFLTRTGSVSAIAAASAVGLLHTNAEAQASRETPASTGEAGKDAAGLRITKELPVPTSAEKPKQSEYKCDVLIVGGGFAGLNAAVAARKEGKSVVLVDKGRPGYSGLSAFPSSHRWFDPEFGDDPEAFRRGILQGGEYLANMDWFDIWIEDSKAAYLRLKEWGILAQYPNAVKAGGYEKTQDFPGYREKFDEQDRHAKFVKVLADAGVQYVVRTMITNLIKEDDRIVGAMGFDVPSGSVMNFSARSVVLCTGGGSYKPAGYPTGSDTFDGEYIAYQLGLPIVGKEFDDFHMSVSYAPGNAFLNNSWPYLENIWLCGGDMTKENTEKDALIKARVIVQARMLSAVKGLANNDGTRMEDLSKADITRRGGTWSKDPRDPRHGKDTSLVPKGDIYGAAPGMCAHLSSGIFCGIDDHVGRTAMKGLYVAGDGTNGAVVSGAAYPNGVGFTSNFCSIQGWRAGKAAAQYAESVPPASLSPEQIARTAEEILAPTKIKNGLDPNWVRDVLQSIMAPYWITIAKTESTLRGALVQVEYLRDHVAKQLMAPTSHHLRLCHEMKHKILSAEMKLRAGLERKESRGLHYRTDFPFRDDQNFLCYIAVQKGAEGEMKLSRIDIKPEWKGDVNREYKLRYPWRFPGEAEAKGFVEEPVPQESHG